MFTFFDGDEDDEDDDEDEEDEDDETCRVFCFSFGHVYIILGPATWGR